MPEGSEIIASVTPPYYSGGGEVIEEVNRSDHTTESAVSQSSSRKWKGSEKNNKTTVSDLGNSSESSSPAVITSANSGTEADSNSMMDQTLKNNLTSETGAQGVERSKIKSILGNVRPNEVLAGMASEGGNQKDMASYRFWNTQPVVRFNEEELQRPDGPVREKNLEVIPTRGAEFSDDFEWVTVDLNDGEQLNEVYELLSAHYVEDIEAMFRFNYSPSFLNWALKSPGWIPEWHLGVRVSSSRKLIAFIAGVPINLKVRTNTLRCSEINFLCIHKKLRSKRLAPVLIKEIARRCNVEKVWNAIYTAGIVLPKPISTCRYYHRSLDWLKLYEVGFSPLPPGSTGAEQITRFHLPTDTNIRGLREMEAKDVNAVHRLLSRYLERFDMAPNFDKGEVDHWLLHKEGSVGERVVFTYVVEQDDGHITDFFSFYALESSVINSKKHELIRAAYLFYYASEVAFYEFPGMKEELKIRLNQLINDALVLAKKFKFDVFNALTLLDNTLFLQGQKFGAGDGQLHYYLYNWRTPHIAGGIDEKNNLDEKNGSSIGIVML